MTIVNLQKKVTGETLVEVCLKAAKEMGYSAKPRDEFTKEYRLGSIHEENIYNETAIYLSWGPISSFSLRGIKKGKDNDYFFVWSGLGLGFAPEKNIKKYLSLVSKYLS